MFVTLELVVNSGDATELEFFMLVCVIIMLFEELTIADCITDRTVVAGFKSQSRSTLGSSRDRA